METFAPPGTPFMANSTGIALLSALDADAPDSVGTNASVVNPRAVNLVRSLAGDFTADVRDVVAVGFETTSQAATVAAALSSTPVHATHANTRNGRIGRPPDMPKTTTNSPARDR
jgi:hypothetical protein